MSRFAVRGALAAFAFLATSTLLAALAPLPEAADLHGRARQLEAGGYDVVFLGPSTVRCGLIPDVVDEELARLGRPLRSFNLGIPGARAFELDFWTRRIAEDPPPGLRYAVIELHPDAATRLIGPHNHFTDRAIYWHTPTQLRGVFADLRASDASPLVKLDRLLLHGQHFLWRATGFGQAERALTTRIAGSDAAAVEARGFSTADCTEGERAVTSRQRYLENTAEVTRLKATLDVQRRRQVDIDHLRPAHLRAQVERLRRAGIEPVFVLSPILGAVPGIHSLRTEQILPALLAFDSPRGYPALYAPEARFDMWHLNAEGAERFSRAFARRFVRWLASGTDG